MWILYTYEYLRESEKNNISYNVLTNSRRWWENVAEPPEALVFH
jgi:hypothetical protein